MKRFIVPAIAGVILFAGGCTSIDVTKLDGTHVRYVNVVFDKKIGRLEIPTAAGPAILEGLESKQDLSSELAATARLAISRVPVPSSAAMPIEAPPQAPAVSAPAMSPGQQAAWAERWRAARPSEPPPQPTPDEPMGPPQ